VVDPVTRRADGRRPVDYFAGGAWPGNVDASVGGGPAAVAASLVRRLEEAIGDRSVRSVASEAGIAHTTLTRLLAGKTWPDLVTIVQLEKALGTALWPGAEQPAAQLTDEA
jgi:DNA-binding phage protein